MCFRGNASNVYYIVGSDVYASTIQSERIAASPRRKLLRGRAIILCNTYVVFLSMLRVFEMLNVILRDENESEVRKTMWESKKGWNNRAGHDIKPTKRGKILLEFCKSLKRNYSEIRGSYHELDIRKTGRTRRILVWNVLGSICSCDQERDGNVTLKRV